MFSDVDRPRNGSVSAQQDCQCDAKPPSRTAASGGSYWFRHVGRTFDDLMAFVYVGDVGPGTALRWPGFPLGSGNMLKCLANLMTDYGLRKIHRIGLAVAAFLLVAGATGETEASCGDYLVVSGMDHTTNQSDDELSGDASPMPSGTACHGPQCRRSPALPAPHLPVQSGPSQQERAHLQQLSDSNLPSAFSYRVVETGARSIPGFPFRLERPPHA